MTAVPNEGPNQGRSEGRVAANGIELAYETFGEPHRPAIVLIMGLGTQMLGWPDELCADLAERGHFVVRFDNRDVGHSTYLDDLPLPRTIDVLVGRRPPYTIGEMAEDTVGLLDALGLGAVHLVGASMGGFIAQTVALAHPERVRTLTLIMTSTGSWFAGIPKPRVLLRMFRGPVVTDESSAADAVVDLFRLIGSHGAYFDEDFLREVARSSWRRGHHPAGQFRQLAASTAQPNRTRALRRLRVPTLVVHGLDDPLVRPSGGLALARAVPGARFLGYTGMGHDLPRRLWPDIAREIAELAGESTGAVSAPVAPRSRIQD